MDFKIIKITNNNDPTEFTLEITRMRDIRQRLGIIQSGYNDFVELGGRRKYKPSYDIISQKDFSYYTVFRGKFDTYEQVKKKREELMEMYTEKVLNVKKKITTNIISFE